MTTIDLLKILIPSMAGVAGFAYYMAHLLEHGTSELFKEEMRKFAAKQSLLPAARAAFKYFVFASDRYFGPNLLSWKAALRSVLLSALWILLVLAVCALCFPNYQSWLGQPASRRLILHSAVPLVCVALLIDFISVCLTRSIIKASLGKKSMSPASAVLLDLFLSVLLFYVVFGLAKTWIMPGHSALGPIDSLAMWLNPAVLPSEIQLLQPLTSDMLVETAKGQFDIKGGLMTELVYAFPESILFLSSLLTSVWLWLYTIGYMTLYGAVRADRLSRWTKARLNIGHNPSVAIAMALVLAYVLLCCVIVLIHGIGAAVAGGA